MNITLPHEFTPRPYQQRLMDYLDGFDGTGTNDRAFCVWHRRAGKDLTALHQACKMAHQRRGLYWHMLPSYRQARKVVWQGFTSDGRRLIDHVFPDALVASKNEVEMRLDLKCGSIIQLVGSDNYDSLVGANPVGVTFSEFALNHPSAWNYVRPMLAENRGWAAFITTPRGLNHAWDLWKLAKQDPRWFTDLQNIHQTQALPASIIEEERRNGMPEALIRSEYECDFRAALVGSVWGDLIEKIEQGAGVTDFEVPKDGVFTTWDLGLSDATAIWFWRLREGGGLEFIDYYEAHGEPLSHYADEVESRGYHFVKHWLPHDARARTLAAGVSIYEQLRSRWPGRVAITPKLSLLDGVQAGRWLLQQPTRFHEARCAKGLDALRAYHYAYDEEKKSFSTTPAHDWSSHGADAFRYAAIVAKVSGVYAPKSAPKPKPPTIGPAHYAFTLDMLWDMHGSRPRGRRID